MTLRFRVWCIVRRAPTSAVEVAELLGLEYEHARSLVRDLRRSGYIVLDHRIGRESFYKVSGTPCPRDGRDGRPGPRRGKQERTPQQKAKRPVRGTVDGGYGAGGRIALEECWG